MSPERYTLLLFLAGLLAGAAATILVVLIPDAFAALEGMLGRSEPRERIRQRRRSDRTSR